MDKFVRKVIVIDLLGARSDEHLGHGGWIPLNRFSRCLTRHHHGRIRLYERDEERTEDGSLEIEKTNEHDGKRH